MAELSKRISKDLYPDLIARGGLRNALQSILEEIGSTLVLTEPNDITNYLTYAHVRLGSRSSQVYVAAHERKFIPDFWARGVLLAEGETPDLDQAARAIDKWLTTNCALAELASNFEFVAASEVAAAYERGEEVEMRWRTYLNSTEYPELAEFIQAACQQPQLRQLFPFTSMYFFCFSRCTGYPFTCDLPSVRPLKNGQYQVVGMSNVVLGVGSAQEAAALLVANLPPGCGPATPGTADDLAND